MTPWCKKKMSFDLLWKNKNKLGSEALPTKMTMLGSCPLQAGSNQSGGPSAVLEAGEAPASQVLVSTAGMGSFSSCSQRISLSALGQDITGTCFTGK